MFKRKLPYSQEEVALQIGVITDLMKQRDKSMQLAVVMRLSDSKQQRYLEEQDTATDNIDVSQKVLGFMLESNEAYLKKKVGKS
jgi:hypothetical protein